MTNKVSNTYTIGMSRDNAKKAKDRAIKLAGGVSRLAEHLQISTQAISQWEIVPVKQVLAVEAFTQVPRQELRPDIYPDTPPPDQAA